MEHSLAHDGCPLKMDGKKDAQQKNGADGCHRRQFVPFIGAQDEQGWQQGKKQGYLVDEECRKIA